MSNNNVHFYLNQSCPKLCHVFENIEKLKTGVWCSTSIAQACQVVMATFIQRGRQFIAYPEFRDTSC